MRAKTLKGVQKQNYRRPLPIPPLLHLLSPWPRPSSPKPKKKPSCYFLLSPKLVLASLSPTYMMFSPLAHHFPPFFSHTNSHHPTCPSLLPFFSHANPHHSPLFTHHSPCTFPTGSHTSKCNQHSTICLSKPPMKMKKGLAI